MKKHLICKYSALLIITSSFLISCSQTPWEDVPAIGESVKAGKVVRIEPVNYNVVHFKKDAIEVKSFPFKGTLLDKSLNDYCITNVSVFSGGDRLDISESQTPDTILWSGNELEKELEISYAYIPVMRGYTGSGMLYFYLTDMDKTCISNIVGWEVEFD